MMDVPAIRPKQRQAAQPAAEDSQQSVHYRQRQNKKRGNQSSKNRALVRTDYREQSNLKSEEVCATVAEIDSSWGKIKSQEANYRPRHSSSKAHNCAVSPPYVNEQRQQHECNSPRQAVHPIDQVYQVGEGYQPNHCHEEAPRS